MIDLYYLIVYKQRYNSWNLNNRCPINTYGEVCEYSPDICSDLRPCLNSALCTAGVNALSKCTCPNNGKNFLLATFSLSSNQGIESNGFETCFAVMEAG